MKMNKNEKLKSAYSLKYGTFAVVITVIVIIALIAVNVLINVINNKFPISLDLTSNKDYSVGADNIEFIKGVDYPVRLRVVLSEEEYAEGSYFSYLYNVNDTNAFKYYKQTVNLLKQYPKYNDNIEVEFLDTQDENFSATLREYTDTDLDINYGYIIVECYKDGMDEEPMRGAISFSDCYDMEDINGDYSDYTGDYSFVINGNKVESAVANGIFKTANVTTVNIALITANSTDEYANNFKELGKLNGYEITPCPIINGADFSKYDVMMICAPGRDYTKEEIKIFEDWLDNDGKKGKTLLFFASTASPDLPNLYAMLEEWGIAYNQDAKYYSDNTTYYDTDHTNIYIQSEGTDYTNAVNDGTYTFIANEMLPLSAAYNVEANGNRSVTTLLSTEDSNTFVKPDNDPNWKANGTGDNLPVMLLSQDADEGAASYVVGCASVDFLTNSFTTTKTDNGNLRLIVELLNHTSRTDEDKYIMESKVVSDTSGVFTTSTTQAQTVLVAIVFIGIIPLALIIAAIVVFIRRKNM